jgi:hypothetical protein
MTKLSFIYFQPIIRKTNKSNHSRATRTTEHNTTDARNMCSFVFLHYINDGKGSYRAETCGNPKIDLYISCAY